MTEYLLDVNVLLALMDITHIHHHAAHLWFRREERIWATCTVTQLGFARIASSTRYLGRQTDLTNAIDTLHDFCRSESHRFWKDDIQIYGLFHPGVKVVSSQLTDCYLVGLAVANGGKLATFDRAIPRTIVIGGKDAVEMLPI